MKKWYGKKSDSHGTVYKRFLTMTLEETKQALKSIRATNQLSTRTMTGKQKCHQNWLNKAIKREDNYMFLNLNQAEFLTGDRKHNTAIFIKG